MLGCEIQKNIVPFNKDIKGSKVKTQCILDLGSTQKQVDLWQGTINDTLVSYKVSFSKEVL